MKVDRAEQFGPRRTQSALRRHPAGMDRQPRLAEKTVVQQPVKVKSPERIARHVCVVQHEIHVVDRIQTAKQTARSAASGARVADRLTVGAINQISDLRRIERSSSPGGHKDCDERRGANRPIHGK